MTKIQQHLLDRGDGATVELFHGRPNSPQPVGAILFVHGNQGGCLLGAREAVETGMLLRFSSALNVNVAAVSQPGFGASDGPPDFCGPSTQLAISAALSFLREQPLVDPSRIVLHGTSRGAIASAMVATQDAALRALVLSGGVYDLKAVYNRSSPGLRSAIASEAGLSDEAFLNRSASHHVDRIFAEVMLLHGRRDDRAPVEQAEMFSTRLLGVGVPVALHVFDCGHQIPRELSNPVLRPFLTEIFGPAGRLH